MSLSTTGILKTGGFELPQRPTDSARLVRAAQSGSRAAMHELVDWQWPRAYAVAAAMLGHGHAAEDIAQEAMIKAIESLAVFDSSRPLGPWITKIATNRALDYLRRERVRPTTELHDEPGVNAASDAEADLLVLVEALRDLDEEVRAMVVLKHLGGYSSKEIAKILNSKPATVRSAISRALARLRQEQEGRTDVRQ